MIVLVTGGRKYAGDVTCLDMIDIDILTHGNADGADKRAATHCKLNGIHTAAVDALWHEYGNGAGYKRNAAMLLLKPDYCVKFPGGSGTQSMVDLCNANNIPIWEPYG